MLYIAWQIQGRREERGEGRREERGGEEGRGGKRRGGEGLGGKGRKIVLKIKCNTEVGKDLEIQYKKRLKYLY